jgi:hypothetical protein
MLLYKTENFSYKKPNHRSCELETKDLTGFQNLSGLL